MKWTYGVRYCCTNPVSLNWKNMFIVGNTIHGVLESNLLAFDMNNFDRSYEEYQNENDY